MNSPRDALRVLICISCISLCAGCTADRALIDVPCETSGCSDGMVCTSGECIPTECRGALEFADDNLEREVRSAVAVDEGDLRYGHVSGLTTLDTSVYFGRGEPGVVDLGGIGCLTRLTSLTMDNNEIRDLSPLTALPRLQHLSLVSTPVSDLAPLAEIPELESLDLSNTVNGDAPRDLQPIAGLSNLRELRIAFGRAVDLTPLSQLRNLEVLDAYANDVEDVSPLSELTNLRDVRLDANRVADVSPLVALTSIETLELSDNEVTDIGPLTLNSGLGNGDRVELSGNPVDCLALLQASSLRLLLDRGVDLLIDCLPCLDAPLGLDCRCWIDPSRDECYCHLNSLDCLCEDQPDHPDCFCYFYPDDPACD